MRRMSVGIAVGGVLSFVLCAVVLLGVAKSGEGGSRAASPGPQPGSGIHREDILAELSEDRGGVARPVAEAAGRIARARSLLADDPPGALALLNQVLGSDLAQDDPGANKTWAEAAVLLGDLYAAADRPKTKAIRWYEQAYARLGAAEGTARARIVRTLAGLHEESGEPGEATRLERLARDIENGAVRPLGSTAPSRRLQRTGLAPMNPGADTCDTAISAGVVPPDYVETGMMLAEGDEDWRAFTLTTPHFIQIETVGDPLLCDTNLVLFGGCENGAPTRPLYFNEDRSPSDYTSRIPLDEGGVCLRPGTYYVDVGSFLYLGTQAPFELRIEDLGACVPPVPDAYEPDDELGQAHRIRLRRARDGSGSGSESGGTQGVVQHHTIAPEGDIDFVQFALTRPQVVRIHAGSADDRADTVMGVGYRDSGVFVGVNDNEGPGRKGSVFESCMPAGRWFVAVVGRFFPYTFAYDLEADALSGCAFEREPNGSIATANPLRIRRGTGTINGVHTNVGGLPDFDFYRFHVPTRRGVVLETGAYDIFDVDTYLELYDASGALLASNDDGGQGWLSRIERVLPAGTYYAKVTESRFEMPQGDTWFYSLTVTLSEPPLVEVEPNDACAAAQPVALGKRLLGSINPVGDVDHYLLSVGPSSLGGVQVEIQTTSEGDTVLKMFDDPGVCLSEIGCNDDAVGLDSLITCCIPADASYVVQVTDFANNSVIQDYAIEFRKVGECVYTGPCPIGPGQIGCP